MERKPKAQQVLVDSSTPLALAATHTLTHQVVAARCSFERRQAPLRGAPTMLFKGVIRPAA